MPIATPSTIPSAVGVTGAYAGVKINCGCGFRANTVQEGLDHTSATGHVCHITGEIRPTYR